MAKMEAKFKWLLTLVHVLAGALFLALISQVAFPLPATSVPVTLQVFGVFLLVLLQGQKKAVLSVAFYLVLATCGLPVLAGGKANVLWMTQSKGGYLLGFLAAAWLSGWLLDRLPQTWFWNFISLGFGLFVILSIGASWLAYFIGWQNAFNIGVKPFLIEGLAKIILAMGAERGIKKLIRRLKFQPILGKS